MLSAISLPELDEQGKADFEAGNLTVTDKVINDCTIDLATAGKTYSDVTVSWTSDNACAVVADGKLTVTLPKTETVVTLTATATCGDKTATKEFKVTVSAAATGEKENYGLSTTLKDGDKVIIYNPTHGKALSELIVSDKYRQGEDVTVNKGVISTNLSRLVWTVKVVSGGYQFVDDDGNTLSCTNGLLSADTDNVWKLRSAVAANSFIMESTTKTGTSGDSAAFEWYASKNNFSTYYYKEADDGLYATQFYVLGATPVSTDAPAVNPPSESKPAEESKPAVTDPSTGDTYKLATSLKNGDKVVIYNASSGKALSATGYNGGEDYREGVSVTVNGDTIKTATAALVFEVKVVDGGYQFINGGKALSVLTASDTSKKGLSFADGGNVWSIRAAKAANSFIIESTTFKGTSGDPAAMEWYATDSFQEFSTHYYSEAQDAIYAMQFYVLG